MVDDIDPGLSCWASASSSSRLKQIQLKGSNLAGQVGNLQAVLRWSFEEHGGGGVMMVAHRH